MQIKAPSTTPEDRVPIAQKLGYGLGTVLDMWGHWLYPTLANQVFNIGLGVSPALGTRKDGRDQDQTVNSTVAES